MAFHKNFPLQKAQSGFTSWHEITLSEEEEKRAEEKARDDHITTYNQCLDDAKEIILKNGMKSFDPNIIAIANALLEKRASHIAFYKEEMAKEKFDIYKKENQWIIKYVPTEL